VRTTASAQDVLRARFERGVLKSRSTAPEGQPIAFQLLCFTHSEVGRKEFYPF
jgi:hypothetical protein